MIVFGWNSFEIDACKPSQLGMPPELDSEYTIERRQKYFHLFWIPFFGIGKIWALRKRQDNQLYEPNATLEAALNSLPVQHKTPWYTYSLVWLAMTVGFLFYVSETVSDYNREKRYQADLIERNETLTKSINTPEVGTYYTMKTSDEIVYLKVVGNDAKSLVCLYSTKKDMPYSEHKELEAFVTDSVYRSFDTVRIQKQGMLGTINRLDNYDFKGAEVIKGAGNFVLDELKVTPFPVFKTIGASYEEGTFFAVVQNIGEKGKLKEFTQEMTNLELGSPVFPDELKSGESILLKGSFKDLEPKMRSKLKFESAANGIAEYELNISGTYLSCKQLTP